LFVLSPALILILVGNAAASVAINSPTNGQTVGPNTPITGQASERAFLVVITDLFLADTNEYLGQVPGIRGWTREDNSFAVRIATPRLINNLEARVKYVIRVQAFRAPSHRTASPDLGEASVTVYSG
jgi:hypothetical protein